MNAPTIPENQTKKTLEGPPNAIDDFAYQLKRLLRWHLHVLTTWSLINIISGLLYGIFFNLLWNYFVLMCCSWGVVNGLICLWLFFHLRGWGFLSASRIKKLLIQKHVEKLFLFNIGLDIAYLFMGLSLLTVSYIDFISMPGLWKGFGVAILIQGAFLLLLDTLSYLAIHQNYTKHKDLFEAEHYPAQFSRSKLLK